MPRKPAAQTKLRGRLGKKTSTENIGWLRRHRLSPRPKPIAVGGLAWSFLWDIPTGCGRGQVRRLLPAERLRTFFSQRLAYKHHNITRLECHRESPAHEWVDLLVLTCRLLCRRRCGWLQFQQGKLRIKTGANAPGSFIFVGFRDQVVICDQGISQIEQRACSSSPQ